MEVLEQRSPRVNDLPERPKGSQRAVTVWPTRTNPLSMQALVSHVVSNARRLITHLVLLQEKPSGTIVCSFRG